MDTFIAEIIQQAARLGLGWWERIAIILGTALLIVLGRYAFRFLAKGKLEPTPDVGSDGGLSGPGVALEPVKPEPARQGDGWQPAPDVGGDGGPGGPGFILPTDPDHPGGGPESGGG